ncbi:Uncharacterized protein M6B38_238010 [Iris pallida]|uniref:Uncharacterized protein n=1 Tax=Iris pallida TaxID=29817 RepID=A0AAX6DL88_IRIPA|nr:Uncharacterized protein M6B38_238010 [Iris pallida]
MTGIVTTVDPQSVATLRKYFFSLNRRFRFRSNRRSFVISATSQDTTMKSAAKDGGYAYTTDRLITKSRIARRPLTTLPKDEHEEHQDYSKGDPPLQIQQSHGALP